VQDLRSDLLALASRDDYDAMSENERAEEMFVSYSMATEGARCAQN
jgi:hypothetical protein